MNGVENNYWLGFGVPNLSSVNLTYFLKSLSGPLILLAVKERFYFVLFCFAGSIHILNQLKDSSLPNHHLISESVFNIVRTIPNTSFVCHLAWPNIKCLDLIFNTLAFVAAEL